MSHLFTDQQKYSIGDFGFDFDKLIQNDLYNIDNETGILIYKSYHLNHIFIVNMIVIIIQNSNSIYLISYTY